MIEGKDPGPRRIELPPGVPLWDGVHDISVFGVKSWQYRRGECSCGWRGNWRRGKRAALNAQADADEHHNNVT